MIQLTQQTHDEVLNIFGEDSVFWDKYQNSDNEWRVNVLNEITKKYHNSESKQLSDLAIRCDYAYSLSNQYTIVTDLNAKNESELNSFEAENC